jgi:hypothetical protein
VPNGIKLGHYSVSAQAYSLAVRLVFALHVNVFAVTVHSRLAKEQRALHCALVTHYGASVSMCANTFLRMTGLGACAAMEMYRCIFAAPQRAV